MVFHTDPGTKLDHGPRARVSFEVDSFDRQRRTRWSVVATGRLEEVTFFDVATFERVRRPAVDPWAGSDKAHWMRLVPDRVTGRRIREKLTPVRAASTPSCERGRTIRATRAHDPMTPMGTFASGRGRAQQSTLQA
jgi:hypothetical protein